MKQSSADIASCKNDYEQHGANKIQLVFTVTRQSDLMLMVGNMDIVYFCNNELVNP